MKRMYFSDKCCLTNAALERRMTQMRKIISCPLVWHKTEVYGYQVCKNSLGETYSYLTDEDGYHIEGSYLRSKYNVGDICAVCQSYSTLEDKEHNETATSFGNKLFVYAKDMPHKALVTGVRIERMQDISYEDILKCGVRKDGDRYVIDTKDGERAYDTPVEAYKAMTRKVYNRHAWEDNPHVFVYDFELCE